MKWERQPDREKDMGKSRSRIWLSLYWQGKHKQIGFQKSYQKITDRETDRQRDRDIEWEAESEKSWTRGGGDTQRQMEMETEIECQQQAGIEKLREKVQVESERCRGRTRLLKFWTENCPSKVRTILFRTEVTKVFIMLKLPDCMPNCMLDF